MAERMLTTMYDTRGAAENVRDQLVGIGVPRDAITIQGTDAGVAEPSTAMTEDKGFWASLGDLIMPDEDRYIYTEGLKRGGYLLAARVDDSLREAAADILEGSDPIDMDERTASWRQDGWADYEATAPIGQSAPAVAERRSLAAVAGIAASANDDVIQVAEEELRVGKREVGRGGVRVRTYVTERPVEEQVELRQEHVTIERRSVNRELQAGDTAFQERTIEAVEHGEEAVVSKVARVTEEIGLRKDVEHETETVRDTVRKQEVEVEDDRGARKPTGTGTVVEGSVVDPDLAGTSR